MKKKKEKKKYEKEYVNSRKHYSTYIFSFLVIFNLKLEKKKKYDE